LQVWRLRYNADVHIIAVKYEGSPFSSLHPSFVTFMANIDVNVTVITIPPFDELRKNTPLSSIPDNVFIKAAGQIVRGHHTKWTNFKHDQIVVASDIDVYPTHSHMYARR
jgi:hypothetical protein